MRCAGRAAEGRPNAGRCFQGVCARSYAALVLSESPAAAGSSPT